jgi:hypothetical protein
MEMKKIYYSFLSMLLPGILMAQTCTNCGVNQAAPLSSLHVTGCGFTSGTSGFRVDNSGGLISIFARDDQRVGIGNTSPLSLFHVSGNLTIGTNTSLGMVGNMQLTTGGTSPISNRLVFGTDGTGWKFAISKNQAGTTSDLMIVQDNGNVGIGSGTANVNFDVQGASPKAWVGWSNTTMPDASTGFPRMLVGNSLSSQMGFLSLISNETITTNTIGELNFANYTLGTTEKRISAISGILDGATNSGRIVFSTSNAGTLAERVRIANDGHIGFGMSTGLTAGIGFQSNVGLVRFSDPANATRFLQINSNYAGTTGIPASVYLSQGSSTSGEGLTLIPNGGGSAGVSIGGSVYNGTYWRPMWLAQNVSSGEAVLSLVSSGGYVGIATTSPTAKLAVGLLGGTAASTWFSTMYPTSLSSTSGTDLNLASIGFGTGNASSLGIHGYRSTVTGGSGFTDWQSTSIVLGMDVDNTTRASKAFVALHANGCIGFSTLNPTALLDFKDGHIKSEQTTAPTIASSYGTPALSSATDTKGQIQITGAAGGGNTTITFNKTYNSAPIVVITPANTAAQSSTYMVTSTTTTFVLTIGAGAGANPNFNYYVIE